MRRKDSFISLDAGTHVTVGYITPWTQVTICSISPIVVRHNYAA
jgi:hypothetical protein